MRLWPSQATVLMSDPQIPIRSTSPSLTSSLTAGRLRVRMSGHLLRDLDAPAVRQIVRDAGRAERVAAYRGLNARVGSTAAHHIPNIRARHHARPEFLGFADSGLKEDCALSVASTREATLCTM
jgi:hypothetical protein